VVQNGRRDWLAACRGPAQPSPRACRSHSPFITIRAGLGWARPRQNRPDGLKEHSLLVGLAFLPVQFFLDKKFAFFHPQKKFAFSKDVASPKTKLPLSLEIDRWVRPHESLTHAVISPAILKHVKKGTGPLGDESVAVVLAFILPRLCGGKGHGRVASNPARPRFAPRPLPVRKYLRFSPHSSSPPPSLMPLLADGAQAQRLLPSRSRGREREKGEKGRCFCFGSRQELLPRHAQGDRSSDLRVGREILGAAVGGGEVKGGG
jgi:hypothetical protein